MWSKNRCSRNFKKIYINSVFNFRRVIHFWLCLLETHVKYYLMHIAHCTVYISHCTLYTLHCILYSVQLYSVQCMLYTIHCIMQTVHCPLRTLPVGVSPSEYCEPSLPSTVWVSTPYMASSLDSAVQCSAVSHATEYSR